MEIITRTAAIESGLKKYFTGEPCKNGHLAERYVQSCTCELCIRGAVPNSITAERRSEISQQRLEIDLIKAETAALRAKVAADRLELTRQKAEQRLVERAETVVTREQKAEQRLALKATRSEMVTINVVVHNDDYELFRGSLLAISRMSDPSIQLYDLMGKQRPLIAGSEKRYQINLFHNDESDIRELANGLLSARQKTKDARILSENEKRLSKVLADAEAEASKDWPEFRP